MYAPIFIMFITLLVCMLIGLPIVWSLGISCITALVAMEDMPFVLLAQRCFHACNSSSFLAVPAFCIAGEVMSQGGISKKLINLATLLLGRIRGSLAMVSIATCALFAAMTGSANATTVAVGSIMYPEMKERGYDPDFSAAVQAVGGTLGPVIPPSVTMIFYGIAANVSISKLLLSGVIPGILCAALMCITSYFLARKFNMPVECVPFSWEGLWKSFKDAFLALLMPVFILGSIYLGICTATESAAIAAVYGIIIASLVYKTVSWKELINIAKNSAVATVNVTIMVITAQVFGWLVTYYNVPTLFAEYIRSISSSPTVFLFLTLIVLLIAGMFMEALSVVVIVAPILAPVAASFGLDPIFYGFFVVFIMCIGIASPPFGPCLFMSCSITGRPFSKVAKWSIPLLLTEVAMAIIVMFVPEIVTFLPNMM